MSRIFDLDKEAMDLAIEIVHCEKTELDSEFKELKLKKLRERLEVIKRETEELMKGCNDENSIGKELLGGLFGTREREIKYGSERWKELFQDELSYFEEIIDKLEDTLLDLDISEEQDNKLFKLVEELKDTYIYFDDGIKLGFEDF